MSDPFNQLPKSLIEAEDRKKLDKLANDDFFDSSEDRVFRTFSSESTDSGVFWTFAPYVYENFKDQSKEERLRKILTWALLTDISKDQLDSIEGSRQMHLRGLRNVYMELGGLYYLPNDPDHTYSKFIKPTPEHLEKAKEAYKIIHNFTDQEAKRLVEAGTFD